MKLSLPQLVDLARRHGFPDPELAAAIAWVESGGGYSCAQGDPNIGASGYLCDRPNGTSQSFGLWQVNVPANPKYDPTSLLDPDYNASAAYEIYNAVGGSPPIKREWRPWSTAWEYPFYAGYLGAGAPFRKYYRPAANDFSQVTPPLARPSDAPVAVLGVALLAAVAGYVASERARFA